MTDQEITRFNRRLDIFIREGLCRQGAFDLATAMHNRDMDPDDDRRVCFECQNYTGKVCLELTDHRGKYQMPLRFILQRCDSFKLKGTK